MYQVIDLTGLQKGDNWQIRKNNMTLFTGGFRSVVRYAVNELGFDICDFERAVSGVVNFEHNTLEFDRSKRLVATSYTPPDKFKKTG